MSANWKDFVKSAQLFPGQWTANTNFASRKDNKIPSSRKQPSLDEMRKSLADKGYKEFQPDEDVSHFYNVIVPGIAASNPLTGSGSTRIKPNFWKDGLLFYNPSASDAGRYYSRRSGVTSHLPIDFLVAGGRNRGYSTLVHEMKHMQHDDAPPEVNVGPYDRDLLAKAYPFDRDYWHRTSDLVSGERRAVNAQHQFRAMMDLKKSLGRLPTSAEYIKYIKDMPAVELSKYILAPLGYDKQEVYPNAPVDKSPREIDSNRIESYRKALMSIARNGGMHTANNTAVA